MSGKLQTLGKVLVDDILFVHDVRDLGKVLWFNAVLICLCKFAISP
jgi:hypothetical protein